MLWRFLAMEEVSSLVTMIDSDLANTILPNLERTELLGRVVVIRLCDRDGDATGLALTGGGVLGVVRGSGCLSWISGRGLGRPR